MLTSQLGVYMDINDPTIYTRQLSETMKVLNTFKPSNVLGITVGNEILLQAQSAGNSVTQALADVTTNIRSVKSAVAAMGLSIPVGSGDAGSMLTEAYGAACDCALPLRHAIADRAVVFVRRGACRGGQAGLTPRRATITRSFLVRGDESALAKLAQV